MKRAGNVVEDARSRARTKGEAGDDVVLPWPVHTKQLPFRGQDWDLPECRFQLHLGHHGSFVKSAKHSHCIVNSEVMDGGIFLRDEVVDAKALWC